MPTRPPRARPPTRRNAGGGTGRSTFILLRTTPNRFSPLLKFARTPLFGGWLCPSDPELLLYPERDFAPLHSPMRGGLAPSSALHPHAGAPPRAPGVYAELGAPEPPDAGAPPCTRVTFPSRGKSPKARQGLRPLESPWDSAKLWEPDEVRFEGWNAKPIELKAITIPYRPFRARLRIAPGYLLPQKKTDLPL